jgi:HSP20 family protein
MAIVKWEPFGEFDRFFDDFAPSSFTKMSGDMAVDLYEEGNAVVAEMSLPGADPEKVDVTVEGQYLRVIGTREEEKETKNKQFYSKEIRRGSFERAIRLPEPVNDTAVTAEYENGVLKVTMPKLGDTKKDKIKVVVKGK